MLAAVELDGVLGDVVFLAITVAFFVLAWLLVRVCERIAGADTVAVSESASNDLAYREVEAA
jgi:hypothetical protein